VNPSCDPAKVDGFSFRELFEHMTSGVAVYEAVRDGEDFRIKDMNPAGLRMVDLPREAVVGRLLSDLFPGAKAMGIPEMLRRVWQTGRTEELPPNRYFDSRLARWFSNRIFRLPSGTVAAVFDDDTHRLETERALRESEERFRILFENHAAMKLLIDPADGHIVDANEAAARFYGWTRDQLRRMRIQDINTLSPDEVVREMQKAREQRRIYFDFRHRRADGSIRDVAVFSSNIAVAGSPPLLHSIIHDVTEFKQAQAALAENDRLLRIAGRTAAIGGWSVDLAENRVVWSDEVAAIHERPPGYSPSVDEGISYYATEWRERIAAVFRACAERGEPYDEIMEIVTAHGRRRWVRTIGEAVRDETGRIVKVQGAFQDITERKAAEAEHERIQNQLAQLQKLESIGRLAGGVAHDFNNMLQVILGNVDFALERQAAGATAETYLQEIRRAATRSAELTRQLLAFARKQTVAPRVLDLNETVGSALQMLRRLIGENVGLIWRPGAELPAVRMDPVQIDQILANLCANARDAIPGTGTVTIATERFVGGPAETARHPDVHCGEFVCLSVADDGAGMEPEIVAQLFEPFFTTKAEGQGTGLGLATVYGVVRQNGGFIEVDSRPGRGSCFRIYLPAFQADAGDGQTAPPPPVPGQETILLVEDEPGILTICKAMLGSLGYRVLGAATPHEAIRLAERNPGGIQLLITDIVMPEMNGWELAQAIMALQPNLKRLFMSGYTADVIAHQGVRDNEVHLLSKPFTLNEISTKIRQILGS